MDAQQAALDFIQFPQRLDVEGGTPSALLRQMNYAHWRGVLTERLLRDALEARPECLAHWMRYSDERSGWAIEPANGRFVVMRTVGGAQAFCTEYEDLLTAWAALIRGKLVELSRA